MGLIYPLDQQVDDLLQAYTDEETGEMIATEEEIAERIEALQIEFDTAIDSFVSEVKNLDAEIDAIKAEEFSLSERRRRATKKRDRLKRYVSYLLRGERWQNGRHKLYFKKTEVAVVDDEFVKWAEQNMPGLLSYSEPTPKKMLIREAMQNGIQFDFAHLETKSSLIIQKIKKEKENETE